MGMGQHFEYRIKELPELRLAGVCIDGDRGSAETWMQNIQQVEQEIPRGSRNRLVVVSDDRAEPQVFIGYHLAGADEKWPQAFDLLVVPAQRYGLKWHYGAALDTCTTYEVLDRCLADQGWSAHDKLRIEFHRRPFRWEETEADLYTNIEGDGKHD